jgi:FkbM family methyltransferase
MFNRLLNASPRSTSKWLMRRCGVRRSTISSDARPAWERVAAGPLAGREIFIDRQGSGAWEDMLAGRFDAEIYEIVARAVPAERGIVWDVGAHIGFHTLGFSVLVGHTGRVVGFEPNAANRQRLQQNLEHNPDLLARIDILPCGLSDQDGEFPFAISDDVDSGASSMSFLDRTNGSIDPHTAASWNRVVVPVRTADSLVGDGVARPHVVKIDVEGAELLVLRGASEMITAGRPVMIVEAHSARLVFDLQEWLASRGYQVRLVAELAPSRVLLHAIPA